MAGSPSDTAEVRAQPAREGEDDVSVGDRLQDLLAHQLAKGDLALCLARGTETAFLVQEGEQVFVAASRAPYAGKVALNG